MKSLRPGRQAANVLSAPIRRRSPRFTVPRRWAWHYRALLHLRETLLHQRDEHARAIRLPLDHGGEDLVDVANEKSERHTLLAELRLEDAELAEVEAALDRIRQHTYGRCEITGRPISAARLRAIPWTRLSRVAALHVTQRLQR